MTGRFAAVILLFCTVGCAIVKQDFKQGAVGEDQFDRDATACEALGDKAFDGRRAARDTMLHSQNAYNNTFEECMRGKGYERKW